MGCCRHRPWSCREPDAAGMGRSLSRPRSAACGSAVSGCVCSRSAVGADSADEIRGLYLKGSSVKAWESPLDYVPEVSDVDIHVWFRDDNSWRRHLDTVPQALKIQAGVEACFKDRIARPIHHPRLQLIVLNALITGLEGFVHAPRSTVTVLHGEAYPKADYSDPDTSGATTRPTSSKGPRGWSRCPCKSSISLGSTRARDCASWSGGLRRWDRSCCISRVSTPSGSGA